MSGCVRPTYVTAQAGGALTGQQTEPLSLSPTMPGGPSLPQWRPAVLSARSVTTESSLGANNAVSSLRTLGDTIVGAPGCSSDLKIRHANEGSQIEGMITRDANGVKHVIRDVIRGLMWQQVLLLWGAATCDRFLRGRLRRRLRCGGP